MTALRVAYLPPMLGPGGAERQMLALGEGLPKDRFQVDYLCMSGAGPYDERARAAGAGIRYLGTLPSITESRPRRMAGRIGKTLRYVQAARAGRYDVVDAWLYPVDVMAVLGRWATRTPVVVTGRYNLRDFGPPMSPLARRLNDLANRHVDAVVANAQAVAEDTLRHEVLDPRKLRVIRNGVVPIDPLPGEQAAALRQELGVAEGEVLIGCVANYSEVKRHDLLIEAVAALRQADRPVRLLMVGEGPMRPSLERQISTLGLNGIAVLHGRVTDPRPLYSAFDIVALSSRSEGLPNALLEAASASRPIVATAVGGCGEVVRDGENGLLVQANDAAALTGALDRLLADPELRRRFGSAGRQRTDTEFSMGRFIADYAALYEELAAARR